MEIINVRIQYVRLLIDLYIKSMWKPISIDQFVKVHLKKKPNDNEKTVRMQIDAALDYYSNGIKCRCGKDESRATAL